MAWPKTKAGTLARKRNFHKFQIKGMISNLMNQLNDRDLIAPKSEQLYLASAVNSLEDALLSWESSTQLMKTKRS